MEKFAECVQDSEQLKSALLEMQVYNLFFLRKPCKHEPY